MKQILFLILSLQALLLLSATTNTSGSGNWNTSGNWDNGVPGGTDDANVNHDMTINTNISTSRGDYTINSPIIDITGGSAYNLSISGTGGNQGNFDVNANATFEGTLNVNNNGTLTIRSGDTLTVGATTFANGSTVVIESGGVLIVNGNLTNNNNSDEINVDGTIIVYGNVTGGNGSEIFGSGSIQSSGTITTSGSGSVFGTTSDCSPGPCGIGAPPLPIVLIYFTAEQQGSVVNIEWQTLSEINNDFFSVERSLNARDFEVISTMKGAGNNRGSIVYSSSDDNPHKGVNYYRLKQTDFNGAFSYSEVVAVSMLDHSSGLQIFPNPVVNGKLSFKGDLVNPSLEIINAQGQLVRHTHRYTDTNLNLEGLTKGTYTLVLRKGNEVSSAVFVIQ